MSIRNTFTSRTLAGVGAAALSLGLGLPASAQETAAAADPNAISTADTIVVLGRIEYRNRTESTAPVLEYGTDYFQRFEPNSAGDALKRVPSVTFLSDVLESDGVRLRGLDPAYTQILINGEKVPGAGSSSGAFGNGAETSFFVDRIPAELIDRIEIVRSASANRSGDAMAGALNIVLRDGYSLEGGYVKAGALMYDDGRARESLGAVWGGAVGEGRLLLGANLQGRRNPKEKFSQRFDEPGGSLDNTELQKDTRNGSDMSANFAYTLPVGAENELRVDGYITKTDRTQFESSTEFANGVQTSANIETLNINDVVIDQESWSLNGRYKFEMAGGKTKVKLGYASFQDETYEFENEIEYLRDSNPYPESDRFTRDLAPFSIQDHEIKGEVSHARDIGALGLEVGVQAEQKERDTFIGDGRFRTTAVNNRVISDATGAGVPGLINPVVSAIAGGDNTITRTHIDPFALVSGKAGAIKWEAGVRVENTTLEIEDRTVRATQETDTTTILPSAHVKWSLTDADRVNLSFARTVRHPSFAFLSPATLEAELGENDFTGNPALEPETAWGVDVGYEHRIGKAGVVGVNVFYRAVSDLIEVFNTQVVGSEGTGTWVFSARNSGDGTVYGIEFDASTPLSFIGLDDTGVFANFSYLDSDVDDEFGSRRFNSQSEYVYNFGFIQDLPSLAAAFGATYRKQGDALSRVVGEEVTTAYGADLEVFVEKSFGKSFTVRAVGSNLLDSSKDESFNKFNTLSDQIGRSFAEYELETEQAGPVYQIMARVAF